MCSNFIVFDLINSVMNFSNDHSYKRDTDVHINKLVVWIETVFIGKVFTKTF